MGKLEPKLLSEFVKLIDLPLFCSGKKAEDFTFVYDKECKKVGLHIDGVLVQFVSNEVWARFSI